MSRGHKMLNAAMAINKRCQRSSVSDTNTTTNAQKHALTTILDKLMNELSTYENKALSSLKQFTQKYNQKKFKSFYIASQNKSYKPLCPNTTRQTQYQRERKELFQYFRKLPTPFQQQLFAFLICNDRFYNQQQLDKLGTIRKQHIETMERNIFKNKNPFKKSFVSSELLTFGYVRRHSFNAGVVIPNNIIQCILISYYYIARAQVVFDLDETILTTTRCTEWQQNGRNMDDKPNLDSVINAFDAVCDQLNVTLNPSFYLISNGSMSHIEYWTKTIYPGYWEIFEKYAFHVVSSRDIFEPIYPNDAVLWKIKTFKMINYQKTNLKQIADGKTKAIFVSIGDGIAEYVAAKKTTKNVDGLLTRIYMKPRPDPNAIVDQLYDIGKLADTFKTSSCNHYLNVQTLQQEKIENNKLSKCIQQQQTNIEMDIWSNLKFGGRTKTGSLQYDLLLAQSQKNTILSIDNKLYMVREQIMEKGGGGKAVTMFRNKVLVREIKQDGTLNFHAKIAIDLNEKFANTKILKSHSVWLEFYESKRKLCLTCGTHQMRLNNHQQNNHDSPKALDPKTKPKKQRRPELQRCSTIKDSEYDMELTTDVISISFPTLNEYFDENEMDEVFEMIEPVPLNSLYYKDTSDQYIELNCHEIPLHDIEPEETILEIGTNFGDIDHIDTDDTKSFVDAKFNILIIDEMELSLDLRVSQNWSINNLKDKVLQKYGIQLQHLLYEGTQLTNDKLLKYYGIHESGHILNHAEYICIIDDDQYFAVNDYILSDVEFLNNDGYNDGC